MPARYRNADLRNNVLLTNFLFSTRFQPTCTFFKVKQNHQVSRLFDFWFIYLLCVCSFNASTRIGVALRGSCKVAKDWMEFSQSGKALDHGLRHWKGRKGRKGGREEQRERGREEDAEMINKDWWPVVSKPCLKSSPNATPCFLNDNPGENISYLSYPHATSIS